MKSKHAAWTVALATVLASPAVLSQQAVVAATGPAVTSGTGVVVTPGVRDLIPAAMVAAPAVHLAQAGTSTSMEGNTRTTVTRYWVGVPAEAGRDPRFLRWQGLR